MDEQQIKLLVLMFVGAFICGLIVLFWNDQYRFGPIIKSNEKYYRAVKVTPPTAEPSKQTKQQSRREQRRR